MMKNHKLSVLALCGLGLFFYGGCQNSNPQELASSAKEKSANVADVSNPLVESVGCCSKCKSDQSLKQQVGSCKECADASDSTKEGCCGNCQAESKPAEKTGKWLRGVCERRDG